MPFARMALRRTEEICANCSRLLLVRLLLLLSSFAVVFLAPACEDEDGVTVASQGPAEEEDGAIMGLR